MPASAIAVDEKVKQIIFDQLDVKVEAVVADARFMEDLGTDSLDVVELVMLFKENLDLVISDTNASTINTVKGAMYDIEQNYKPKEAVSAVVFGMMSRRAASGPLLGAIRYRLNVLLVPP